VCITASQFIVSHFGVIMIINLKCLVYSTAVTVQRKLPGKRQQKKEKTDSDRSSVWI